MIDVLYGLVDAVVAMAVWDLVVIALSAVVAIGVVTMMIRSELRTRRIVSKYRQELER